MAEPEYSTTPDRDLRRRPRGDYAWIALGTIVMGAVVVYLWRPAARLDFYFDEMWRIEQVRSPDPVGAYLDGPAPIPPGWVTSLSALFEVFPARRPSLRLAAAIVGVPAGVLFIVTLRRLLERSFDRPRAWAAATLGGAMTFATPGLALHMTYFNNYMADVAVAVSIIWALVAIDDDPSAPAPWWALLVIAVVAPWFAQGALFLVPGAAIIVFLHRRANPKLAAAVAVSAAVSTSVVAWFFLRPVANGATLTDFWKPETPAIGLRDFLQRFVDSMNEAVSPTWTDGRPVAVLAVFGFAVLGAIVVQRAWVWWLPLFLLAQLLAVATSVATGWPATFVRNNSSFQILVAALAPLGIAVAIVGSVEWVRNRTHSVAAAAACAGALVVAVTLAWLPRTIVANAASTAVFARGLSDDATFIAANAGPGDLAVAYHLSGPYLRDRLLNFDDVAPGLRVIDEAREGRGAMTDLDPWTTTDTGTIWCLVPFEAGPDATAASCQLRDSDWEPVAVTTGQRATIVELQRER